MTFKALVVDKIDDKITQEIQTHSDERLPEGNVIVNVEYSSLNYKDGLCLTGNGGLVRNYPHVPGIDYSGTVESSEDKRYQKGDKVVLTGWRVGEVMWGGYAQKTRINADYLVPLPEGISTRDAMAVGTAGMAAMLAVMALEDHGLKPDNGEVLVTGSSGGVGSIATAILSQLGYQVAGVRGLNDSPEYIQSMGASRVIELEELSEPTKRPLESETWAGCVDAVGGQMLARILGQMKYGASVSAVGLAGGTKLPATVIPFLLRGVNLLGIDSVMQPFENRTRAWQRIATDLPLDKISTMITLASLQELPELGHAILKGQIKGRVVVDLNT